MSGTTASVMTSGSIGAWTRPRTLAWVGLTLAAGVLADLPFSRLQIIPHHLDFNPGVFVAPLSGVCFGPAGAIGSAAAVVLGDRLQAQLGWLSVFHATGAFLFALSARRLWRFAAHRDREPAESWMHTLNFVLASWLACCVSAAWQGFGSEALRLYPFAYTATLALLQGIIFCTVLGAPAYRLMARWWVPRYGVWGDRGEDSGDVPQLRSVALVALGGAGALLTGLFISQAVHHVKPFSQPFVVGMRTGILVPVAVLPFLLAGMAGLIQRKRTR